MTNIFKKLASPTVTTLIVSTLTSALFGDAPAGQKTAFTLRNPATYAAAFCTYHQLNGKNLADFPSRLEITGFYNQTENNTKLGNNFGANGTNCIVVGTPSVAAGEHSLAAGLDVENNLLLHYRTAPAHNLLAGKIWFEPERTTWGTCFDIFVKMDNMIKGMYFKANCALMQIKHNLHMKITDDHVGALTPDGISLTDLLAGKSTQRKSNSDTIDNQQGTLNYAKIDGSHSQTGIGNTDLFLGWRFVEKKDRFVGINILLQIPSSNQPSGEFLWEPRLGSNHWALGGSFECNVNVWKKNDGILSLFLDANYRYQFEENEKRTLGLKNIFPFNNPGQLVYTQDIYAKHILGHYYLLAEKGLLPLLPAANVLTKPVEVEPGSMVDAIIGFNYTNKNFTFDLGYNLFWKDAEKVSLKTNSWTNDKYGFPSDTWATCDTSNPFDLSDKTICIATINTDKIDTSVAAAPSILSHSIFGGLGHVWRDWQHPFMLGIGGAYEFGDDEAGNSYTLWLKAGLAF